MSVNDNIKEFMQKESLDRFLRYVKIETTSSEYTGTHPSTPTQLELAKLLKQELEELELENVTLDEYGYVYADLPASKGLEEKERIGLIAHMDTAPAASGKNVEPIIHKNYSGEVITFPKDPELTLSPADSPQLNEYINLDIITASGDTLLGADDKAGIAEIMAALATWKSFPELKHGPITICFTPDEEIGEGTLNINKERLPKFCYTIDGGEMGEIETECFDAWKVEFVFNGLSVHPGYAKNKMINALDVACRFFASLPEYETPEHTEGREGFYHLYTLNGEAEKAKAVMIIRDFDKKNNEKRIELLKALKETYEKRYSGLTIDMNYEHSYENMRVYLEPFPKVKQYAEQAIFKAGLDVKPTAIRGGTDGARLSAEGIPTPNLFAGGLLFHSRKEYIPTLALQKGTEVIVYLAEEWITDNK